ncbi:MAG TPA: glutaredoxin family protein [Candidatus Saccharimonadales bacterium]|nr:glutaredoxin family protein [Candidatus Saccharimonadales bacterium]
MDMAEKTTPQVTVYSSPTCAFCHMAMDYFKQKGVPYVEKDISVDQDALRFVLEKVGQAVTPIITIGDQIVIGFDRPRIDEALKEIQTTAA